VSPPEENALPSSALRVVVALMGVPGAGKSTVARYLSAALPLHVIDRDAIRAALFPRCEFTSAEKDAANAAVLGAVEANCRLGRASLVDGMTFARASDLDALRERVVASGFLLLPLFLECPAEVARARVTTQMGSAHPARDRSPALVTAVAARFDAPPADARRINADQTVEQMCAAALAAVRAALGSELGQS
jgi:predicted kinase